MNSSSIRLVRGQTYFIVMFDDENLTIPLVQTLIYRENGRRADGTSYFLFKELHVGGKQSDFFVNEADLDHLVLDRAGLLRKLKDSFDGTLSTSPPTS
jgi:hypothetical protein